MKTLALLLFGVSSVLGSVRPTRAAASPGSSATLPNIVFILADDLGWNALGCYGQKGAQTPNLDRLAQQGLRFTSAYADCQCSPTRAALFTGQYGARTGLHKVLGERDPKDPPLLAPPASEGVQPSLGNLAQTLRRAGYATGMSGKWHISDGYDAAPLRKLKGGHYFDQYGFDFVGDAKQGAEPDKHTDAITDDLLGFIEKNKDRPFFTYFAYHAVHTPIEAQRAVVKKYVDRGFHPASDADAKPEERPTADYLAMIDHLDADVGRVMEKIDELHLSEKTVLIFYSDNGGLSRAADQTPLRGGKGSAYEGGIRVPLIVRWPGVTRPSTSCDTPVHAVDFYPTFAALAASPDMAAGHPLDGVSFVPLLHGATTLDRPAIFWHMPTYTPNFGRTPCSAVRKGDWKLVHFFGDYLDTDELAPVPARQLFGRLVIGERTELYNLNDDLGEQHDLAATHPEKVAELMSDLKRWWKETGAKTPARNANYDPLDAAWWKT